MRVHWLYLGLVFALAGLGLPFLRSAASSGEFSRQLVWMGAGMAVFAVVSLIDYRRALAWAWPFYGATLALLAFVLTRAEVKGARSWIQFPGFSVQPSEIAKPALILILALYLSWRGPIRSFAGLVPPFLLMLVPMALVLRQPDLGTALTFPPALLAMLFVSGASITRLGTVTAAGAALAVPLLSYSMKYHQRMRILAWLDPETHASGPAFQLLMSLTAIAQGGVWGQGLGNGTLNDLNLLPEKHNDFIFGVVAEEGGLLAAGLLAGLFLLLVLCGLSIAAAAVDEGGRLIAAGVSAMIGMQALMNIGVVTGLLPTTGITLPLVSYGGSSLLTTFAMLGLVMNVAAREREPQVFGRNGYR